MATKVEIVPDGDLLLVLKSLEKPPEPVVLGRVGREAAVVAHEHTILVNSQVLMVMSPIFKRMLGSRFIEGVEFAQARSEGRVYHLTLHDDDPEAAAMVCEIVHFKYRQKTEQPKPWLLERLAVFCDKYACGHILQSQGQVWLTDYYGNRGLRVMYGHAVLCHLLVFTYVADLPKEFCDVAWNLVLRNTGPICGGRGKANVLLDSILPQAVIDNLDSRRAWFIKSYRQALRSPTTIGKWATLANGGNGCRKDKAELEQYSNTLEGRYRLRIDGSGIGRSGEVQHKSLQVLLSSAFIGMNSPSSRNDTITSWLNRWYYEANGYKNWYGCLDCIKGIPGLRCRVQHEAPPGC